MAVAFVSTPAATIKAAASSGSFASFSPNAGSGYLVVVSAATNQSGVAATTVAWASGGSGTWAKLKSFNFNQFQPTIEIWAVHCTAAPGASVISVTGNAFVTSVHAPIREMTGHDTTLPTTGGTATATAATGTIACTPNSTGSRIVVGALDVNEGFTATPNAATTMLDSFNNSGAESYACFGTSNTTASTAQTLGVTNTLTGNIQLALEILPAAGGGSFTGTLARTQGNNTLAASGVLGYSGTVAGTQGGNTVVASGAFTPVGISGSLARTQGDNTASASGVVHPVGAVAATQGNNTGAAAGVLGYVGTLARTQGNGTVVASGTFTPSGVSGSVAVGQAANTATAAGVVHPVGTLAVTQANSSLAAAGTLGYAGSLAKAQANGTLAASGTFIGLITGTLAKTQPGNTLAASGTVAASITGTLAETQANNTCAAIGSTRGAFTALPPDRTLIVAAESRTSAPIESRTFTPLAESRILEVA